MQYQFSMGVVCVLNRLYGIDIRAHRGPLGSFLRFLLGTVVLTVVLVKSAAIILFMLVVSVEGVDIGRNNFTSVATLATFVLCLTTHVVMRKNEKRICQLVSHITKMTLRFHQICYDSDNNKTPSAHAYVRKGMTMASAFVAVNFMLYMATGFGLYMFLMPNTDLIPETNRYNETTGIMTVFNYLKPLLMSRVLAVLELWVYCLDALGLVNFSFVCIIMVSCLQCLLRLETNDVRRLVDLYSDAGKVVAEANSIFSFLLAMSSAVWLAKCCLWIRGLACIQQAIMMNMVIAYRIFSIFANLYFFFLTSYLAAKINFMLKGFHQVVARNFRTISLQGKIEYMSFAKSTAECKYVFTCWDFFVFNKGSMLTAAATMLTYTLILYDLK